MNDSNEIIPESHFETIWSIELQEEYDKEKRMKKAKVRQWFTQPLSMKTKHLSPTRVLKRESPVPDIDVILHSKIFDGLKDHQSIAGKASRTIVTIHRPSNRRYPKQAQIPTLFDERVKSFYSSRSILNVLKKRGITKTNDPIKSEEGRVKPS